MKKIYSIKSKSLIISSFLTANSIFALSIYASNNEFTELNDNVYAYSSTASPLSNENIEPIISTVHILKRKLPETSFTSQQPEKKQKQVNYVQDNARYYDDTFRQPNQSFDPQEISQMALRNEQNLIIEQNRAQAKAKYDLAVEHLNKRETELFMILMRESAEMGYKDAIRYAEIYKQDNPKDTFFKDIFQVLPNEILVDYQNSYVQPEKNLNIDDIKNMDIASLEKQAEQNNDDARFELAQRYSQGRGVEKNLDLMNQYLFHINTNQHMAASLFMGESSLKGVNGFEKDLDEAERYLKIAEKLGSTKAQNLLNDLISPLEKNYVGLTDNISQLSPFVEDESIEIEAIEPILFAKTVSQSIPIVTQLENNENQVSSITYANIVSSSIDLEKQTILSLKKLLNTYTYQNNINREDVLFELAYRYGEGIGRVKQNTKTFYTYFNKILKNHEPARAYADECRLSGKHGM